MHGPDMRALTVQRPSSKQLCPMRMHNPPSHSLMRMPCRRSANGASGSSTERHSSSRSMPMILFLEILRP
jgi:hypothetical protein